MRSAIAFLLVAAVAAAVVAYGVDPVWMRWRHGLAVIMVSRRILWPMVGLSVLASLGLLGLIVSGRSRAAWAIGLLPVLAMFSHRFVSGPLRHLRVVEDPPVVDASAAPFLQAGDDVVGLRFEGVPYALPFAGLYRSPMILISGRQSRLAVFWSPAANRVLAFAASREMRARDLEVVGFPADALLVYDSRLGQFINGLTGLTPAGVPVADLHEPLQCVKTAWSTWKAIEPATKVLAPTDPLWQTAPVQPILPNAPLPAHRPELTDTDRVCLLATTPPVALPAGLVGDAPVNIAVGATPALLFRDPIDHGIGAFDRRLAGDLSPRFVAAVDPKKPSVRWTDGDTASEWTIDGVAAAGPKEMIGKKLMPIVVDENLPLGVLRFWYPDLHVLTVDDILPVTALPPPQKVGTPNKSVPRRRKSRHGD